MVPDSLLTPLVRVPLFSGLSRAQLKALADASERIAIDGGQTIIAEDQVGDAAYLLVKGRATRLDGIGRPTETLPLGTLVGEMAMLIATTHSATVVAVEPIKALKFTRTAMLAVMQDDPDIAAHFITKLTTRLETLAQELKAVDKGLSNTGLVSDRAGLPDRLGGWSERAVRALAS
jgi:CRP-like cAMP-binding protein